VEECQAFVPLNLSRLLGYIRFAHNQGSGPFCSQGKLDDTGCGALDGKSITHGRGCACAIGSEFALLL